MKGLWHGTCAKWGGLSKQEEKRSVIEESARVWGLITPLYPSELFAHQFQPLKYHYILKSH